MRNAALFLSAILAFGAVQPASAFDDRGHEIIATVAAHYLTPAVRKQVDAMLKADTDALTPHDIAGAATWADHYRDNATVQHYTDTANWHFVSIYANRPSIPEACFGHTGLPVGAPASRGPANACIIDKIDQFRAELGDKTTAPAERLIALKYLLHLVGDIHAPLHAADMHNQNGKVIQVVAGDGSITPGSLFGYWETALVRRLGHRDEAAQALIDKITPAQVALWSGQVTHIWALETHQIGTDYAYGTMLSRFEDGRFVIEPAELERGQNLLATQMSKAGVRLAALLNETLGGKGAAPASQRMAAADPASGHAIAAAMCAVCHMVDRRGTEGPSFTTAPDFVAIANTGRMSQTVLHSFLTGTHPTMPRLKLSDDQLRQVSTYIMSLKD
ncbi:MAG: S1/P1 nuclease [Rhodospirillaceae bacterium]